MSFSSCLAVNYKNISVELFAMREAMFWDKKGNSIQCRLCARNCKIENNATGVCRVRKNIDGVLYSLVYGRACSVCVDPIEKKPLFHFAPGSQVLSVATVAATLCAGFARISIYRSQVR